MKKQDRIFVISKTRLISFLNLKTAEQTYPFIQIDLD